MSITTSSNKKIDEMHHFFIYYFDLYDQQSNRKVNKMLILVA